MDRRYLTHEAKHHAMKTPQDSEAKIKKVLVHERKYKSFRSYAKNIFKLSLITSVPEITASTSWRKRFVKLTVLILCIIGFVVQTMDFLKMYWSYPTVVNVEISNPFQFTLPAFTVCNRNRYRRSVYCKAAREKCDFLGEEILCNNSARSCPDNEEVYSWLPRFHTNVADFQEWETTFKCAHTKSVIQNCVKKFEGREYQCSPEYQTIPFVTIDGFPNLCYTIESQWGHPYAEPEIHSTAFSITLYFDLQPEEYAVITEPVSIQLAVHDRRMLVNPYLEGYLLTAGSVYSAYISMNEKEALGPPYDTNCTDYISLWKKRNGTGPLNEMMCVEECKLNTLKKEGLCIDRNVVYPNNERLCRAGEYTVSKELVEICTKQCSRACEERSYQLKVEKTGNFDSICGSEWCKNSYAGINIFFKRFRVTKFKWQPKFESVEMFSYIGGYMGMWLGLSLISLFDLFETFLQIMYFPLGRRYWKKKKVEMQMAEKNLNQNRIADHSPKHIRRFAEY